MKIKKFEMTWNKDEEEINKFLESVDVLEIQSSAYRAFDSNFTSVYIVVIYEDK